MKKILSILLAVVMLCTMLPMSTLAFDQYIVYSGQAGCQLTSLQFTQALNPWLLWDVSFNTECDGRVWVTAKDHPNLVGRTVIPTFTYEGSAITFNGTTIESGVTEVVLRAENELVITTDTARAEYQISITEKTNGLPVVLIDTNGADIPDKIHYVDAEISILGSDVYGGEDFFNAVAGIKLRGNSTMGYAKKPYRIKFDKKQNVLDLGKAKSWVLLANYLDPAVIRNQVAFALASRMNAFTAESTGFQVFAPRMKMVEVYLNGEYKGLYDMGDHMQANEIRVAIDESGDEFDDNDVQLYPEGNVGYFIEVEVGSRVIAEGEEGYEDWSAYSYIENVGAASSAQDNRLYFQFKLPEIPSEEQKAYITEYMQTVNDLILAQDEAVWDYLDRDSVIDWYLANEVFKNVDSQMQSSCYLFKDKDGKLYMGPVWDFDLGAGAVSYGGMDDPTGWRTRNNEYCGWFVSLFGMTSFQEAVNERWAALHEEGILDAMFTDIDALTELLGNAATENYEQWHDRYIDEVAGTWLTTPDINIDPDTQWIEQVQYLTTWLKARILWMDNEFGYGEPMSTVLSGAPVIWGVPEYGQTLTVSRMAVSPFNVSTCVYQWYADGVAIDGAGGGSFTPNSSYIGKSITVSMTGRGVYSGTVMSEPVVLQKTTYTYKTTQLVPLISKTHDTIVVRERDNYEISVDGVNWQISGTFTGLEPNTLYRVTYRHGETANQTGGAAGEPLYVITDVDTDTPVDPDPPAKVTIGDVDLDGTVDTADAKFILRHIMGTITLEGDALTAADFNEDGKIDTSDARALLNSLIV